MSSCPAGLQRLSSDVILPAFSRRLPPVAAHLDIGAASRKLSEVAVLSVYEEAGRARSRLLEDRRPARALAASSMLRRRDPGTGFGVVALEARLDPPPTQGCANGVHKVRAVGQPAEPSDHGSSLPLASVEGRCNAWFRCRKTRHRANRSRNYRAGIVPSR
jgi:hypothetical protein